MSDDFFGGLARELVARSARATVSQASPASAALLNHLQATLEVAPGVAGSFLAPPLFEALFQWERAKISLGDVPFLDPDLVGAMSKPPEELASYAFDTKQHPYTHQLRAWEVLNGTPLRSVVVRTGTASGKTE